jgi:hypothetical protein
MSAQIILQCNPNLPRFPYASVAVRIFRCHKTSAFSWTQGPSIPFIVQRMRKAFIHDIRRRRCWASSNGSAERALCTATPRTSESASRMKALRTFILDRHYVQTQCEAAPENPARPRAHTNHTCKRYYYIVVYIREDITQPFLFLARTELLNVCQCRRVFFTRADLDDLRYIVYEDLAISDMSGVKRLLGGLDHGVNRDLSDNDLNLNLREKC